METNRSGQNILETTVSYKARARLTPTLTHVVMYELVTSGAEDNAMSGLKHQAGIKMLVRQYERAAEKLYQPKGYTNEDIMHSIVLLRLGASGKLEVALLLLFVLFMLDLT